MLDPRVQLITVSGALDLAAERRLRSDLSEAAGVASREVVIDLRGVTSWILQRWLSSFTPISSSSVKDASSRA